MVASCPGNQYPNKVRRSEYALLEGRPQQRAPRPPFATRICSCGDLAPKAAAAAAFRSGARTPLRPAWGCSPEACRLDPENRAYRVRLADLIASNAASVTG